MEILYDLWAEITYLFSPLVNILDQRSIFSYFGAIFFVLLFVVIVRLRRRNKEIRGRALWRLLSKRTVWLHRSALLDYKLYLFNLPLMAFVLGFFIINSSFWAGLFGSGLTSLFGSPAVATTTNWGIIAVLSVLQLLALDLGYWLGHAAMHKSPILWQFHKLHHSAEVMTPATEFRQHPVELVLMPCVIGFTTGLSYALLTHWFGTGATAMGVVGYNIIVCIHMLTFHHVRHSHINIRFTGVLGVLLHSPAHHQIHHSDNPKHFDRNMGYMLSIWDWMAGTLHMPRLGERITLGVGREGEEHDSVGNAIWVPFRDAGRLIHKRTMHLWRGVRLNFLADKDGG
ncbi:MAG: Fatty acid hydroxylase/Sterol desaturase [Rhizobium sp.]|nr:Fatty acid hydroxylase/Sterol desaturase [Rhizobium sp.]